MVYVTFYAAFACCQCLCWQVTPVEHMTMQHLTGTVAAAGAAAEHTTGLIVKDNACSYTYQNRALDSCTPMSDHSPREDLARDSNLSLSAMTLLKSRRCAATSACLAFTN